MFHGQKVVLFFGFLGFCVWVVDVLWLLGCHAKCALVVFVPCTTAVCETLNLNPQSTPHERRNPFVLHRGVHVLYFVSGAGRGRGSR